MIRCACAFLFSVCGAALHGAPALAADTDTIDISAFTIPLYPDRPGDHQADRLIFRGGLQMSSTDRRFGGLSDLVVSADGTELLAVSDQAHWFRAELRYDENGDLSAMPRAEMAPMRGLAGENLQDKDGDAEGMTSVLPHDPDGDVLVSFERVHRIWRYDLSNGLGAIPETVPTGNWLDALSFNEGLEGIAFAQADRLIALSENSDAANGDILGGLESYGDAAPHVSEPLTVVRRPPFLVTGAAASPDGGVFVLERRFSILGGVGMEIRFIPAGDIQTGARLNGEVLANLGFLDANIDNMEGIAARRGLNGETLLYVLSDDNYQPPLQRTLLLMFEFKP